MVNSKIIIAPSILSADFGQFALEAKRAEEGGADWLHVDVMDGHFVPNITFGPAVVAALRKATRLPLDVHLMIQHPDRFVEAFAKAGSSTITVHVEEGAQHDVAQTLTKIRSLGCRCGLAINPPTPPEQAMPYLDRIDVLLCMTVNPGFGGQQFIPSVMDKIRVLRSKLKMTVDLEVDGGINTQTARSVVQAGANALVVGNALYGARDLAQAITELRNRARD